MRAKAIIHLDHYRENIKSIKARVGNDKLICLPVKADAYGHGAVQTANTCLEAGVHCFGVADITEAVELINGGVKAPILLFSQPALDAIPHIVELGIIPFISDKDFASILNEHARIKKAKLPVHIKIDTGMGRIGCHAEESLKLARFVESSSGLELAGIATHFAVSDSVNAQDKEYTKMQINRFKVAVDAIKSAGINPGIVHAANSGAIIQHPDAYFDMVRPGILLYGYNIVDGVEQLQVKPVMELKSNVVLIKKIRKDESVSYGRTWIAREDTNIAILPVGYGDGLPRLASGKWQVVIKEKTYPIAGLICMDQCCVDIGVHSNVQRWDEAVIFGGSAPDAAALAAKVGTIPYEITCNINKRVQREYV